MLSMIGYPLQIEALVAPGRGTRRHRIPRIAHAGSWLLLATWPLMGARPSAPVVIIHPVEIREVLMNPGMGIDTFQRFNGDPLNSPLDWKDRNGPLKPNPPETGARRGSSIAYCRWYWSTIEPRRGSFEWRIIDQAIAEAQRHGEQLAFRVMPYDREHPLPAWYRQSGARRANRASAADGAVWQPDFSDPFYLKTWGALVAALGRRYDGHPGVVSVDISTLGYWGEGWSPYMPRWPVQKRLIDDYLRAFHRTPLLMNIAHRRALAYATQQGSGWRLDCLGDMGTRWSGSPQTTSEMLDFYPMQIVRAHLGEVWKRHPVALEVCFTPTFWEKQGWDANYILNQALRWHVSWLNTKSSPIPAAWQGLFQRFERRMGYRFILRRLQYPATIRRGGRMPIETWWFNAGVAPVYRDYQVAMQLWSPGAAATMVTAARVRQWLPGDAVFDTTLHVPASLPAATYRVRVALLDPRTHRPAIRLAMAGRQPDGWYDLGAIDVQ